MIPGLETALENAPQIGVFGTIVIIVTLSLAGFLFALGLAYARGMGKKQTRDDEQGRFVEGLLKAQLETSADRVRHLETKLDANQEDELKTVATLKDAVLILNDTMGLMRREMAEGLQDLRRLITEKAQ